MSDRRSTFQSIIDFINSKKLPLIDLGKAHFDEFTQFSINLKDYLEKYFIGHYNPLGNMFCAQAIQVKLAEMTVPGIMKNWIFILLGLAGCTTVQEYSTCESWDELVAGDSFHYVTPVRVSDPGSEEQPSYTGFWFYDEQQFDITGRYALGMKVYFQERDVVPSDQGDIGYFDLQDGFKWTKIGETTAWNWQQGCRLQWRPNSEEILWNDRSEDGTHFICRLYNFKTEEHRTLPRPVYDVSYDGKTALTHDYARMKHAGTLYAGIPDQYEDLQSPKKSGIERMDMETGEVEFIISLDSMAEIAFPQGYTGETNLYFFREGWNPSGTRFIAFLRNMDSPDRHVSGWSISADGLLLVG